MTAPDLSHVRAWVFDLDNTLYPPGARLFDQIELRMRDWVARELAVDLAKADRLRRDYWRRYGTTLAGLMAEHGTDPAPYLDEVHRIDLSALAPDPALAAALDALPGRRVVFTNGSRLHAERVLEARGLTACFDAVYGVEHAGFRPKPEQAAFEAVFALDGLDPSEGAFFEDDPRNLAVPHALGMACVLVGPEDVSVGPLPHVHARCEDLAAFLAPWGVAGG